MISTFPIFQELLPTMRNPSLNNIFDNSFTDIKSSYKFRVHPLWCIPSFLYIESIYQRDRDSSNKRESLSESIYPYTKRNYAIFLSDFPSFESLSAFSSSFLLWIASLMESEASTPLPTSLRIVSKSSQ